jgi:hypothetical protein
MFINLDINLKFILKKIQIKMHELKKTIFFKKSQTLLGLTNQHP